MVGGNGDSSIPFASARDILRAPKVVQNIDTERASTGENNPALNFPTTAKLPTPSQTAIVTQVIEDDYKKRASNNSSNNPNDPLTQAKKASDTWVSFNSNSPLLADEEENPEAA